MLQIPETELKNILLREGLVTDAQFDSAKSDSARLGQTIIDTLVSRGLVGSKYYNTLLVNYFKVPFADLSVQLIDSKIISLLPENIARQKRIILFGREVDGSVSAVMEDPTDLALIEFIQNYIKSRIKPYFASEADLNKGFSLYSKASAEDYKKIIEENIAKSVAMGATAESAATDFPIVDIVNNILSYALSLGSSDVHIETFENSIMVRFRIDGILHEIMSMPKDIYSAIVARVKLLGSMKIDEHRKPQDGRFRHTAGADFVDIRIAIIPTFYGEKVEMRLLTGTSKPLSFEELGMLPDTIGVLEENIKKSYGMILVCGPTGCGKTTTLYSILSVMNKPEVNIVTIEDPIEYDVRYVNQTQVNAQAGITFANGLRAILRQDPNIIMVGETRDQETADIAVQAALTGHVVLSSLHTNDAPTAIPRLFDMQIPAFLVSSVLNVVMAQRLVRRICKRCIYSFPPSDEMLAGVRAQYATLDIKEFALPKLVYGGKGCETCGGVGYKGRLGIFEVLNVTEEIRKFINSKTFSLDELKNIARQGGMRNMFEDGMKKVELGATTAEELLRVIRE